MAKWHSLAQIITFSDLHEPVVVFDKLETHLYVARHLQPLADSHRRLLEHARHVLLWIHVLALQLVFDSRQPVLQLEDRVVVAGEILLEDLRLQENGLCHLVPVGKAFGFLVDGGLDAVVEESFDSLASLCDFDLKVKKRFC